MSTAPEAIWEKVRVALEKELGEATFKSWIKPLVFVEIVEEKVFYNVSSRFMKDWILTNYGERIIYYWQEKGQSVKELSIEVDVGAVPSAAKSVVASPAVVTPSYTEDELSALDPRFTFKNFIVGKPNELAYAAALRVSEAESPLFNPLFLYGGVGLGKTHLMHAIAWNLKKVHKDRKILYVSAEKFMYQFVKALRYKDTVSFKEQFRRVDVLMIDDVQFISGKESTQEEFFHTFNTLVDNNRQVILSADKSPSDLEDIQERLKSRLGWGLVADIHPTTYELRLGILDAKADNLKVEIPKNVKEFLALKITSNIRELEGALNRIVAHSTLVGRQITLDTTQDVLTDLLRSTEKRITVEDIQRKICEFYKVKMSDLLSSKRLQSIARPRQVAMYFSKTLTTKSLPEIGRKFGGKDHTTVLHSVRKVQDFIEKDREFASDIDILSRLLEK